MGNSYRDIESLAIKRADPAVLLPFEVCPEQVVLMISPCRSGSTVMLRVFGYAGFMAYFQPLKNAIRWRHLGEVRPRHPPSSNGPVFIKETFGPHAKFETEFDPLDMLLRAGLPARQAKLVVLQRAPEFVWASWQAIWGPTVRLETLEAAYRACLRVLETAASRGVGVEALDYAKTIADPQGSFDAHFRKLGYELPKGTLTRWQDRPGFAEPGSGVAMPIEPELYASPKAHASTIASTSYGAVGGQIAPSEQQIGDIAATEIPALSAALVRALGARGAV